MTAPAKRRSTALRQLAECRVALFFDKSLVQTVIIIEQLPQADALVEKVAENMRQQVDAVESRGRNGDASGILGQHF